MTVDALRRPSSGTLSVQAVSGGVIAEPQEGAAVRFGRHRDLVDVGVGLDDDQVSRQHGLIVLRRGTWWLSNTGRGPIELPQSRWLRPSEEPIPLARGYTTLHVLGSRDRDHLLELYVAGVDGFGPTVRHSSVTRPTKPWELSQEECLVLVALGQRYLHNDPGPQPLTHQQVADLLVESRPDGKWTKKKVEQIVDKVRKRLAARGIEGLLRDEVGEPVGNALGDNLLKELMRSMTLTPEHLDLIESID
ncbi:MAG TPA: FHA domain-containing protein [Pseudonocardiaceae bacterium]